jgi:hypothetical protein
MTGEGGAAGPSSSAAAVAAGASKPERRSNALSKKRGRTMKMASHVMTLLGGAVVLASCTSEPREAREEPAAPVVDPGAAQEAQDALLAKRLDSYITECLNLLPERVIKSREVYLSWVNPDTGPTGQERDIRGLYRLPEGHERCIQALQKAGTTPSGIPQLDQAAQGFSEAVIQLTPVMQKACVYYETRAYQTDNWALAKSLHVQLMSSWARFDSTHAAFSNAVESAGDQLDMRELARLEKQGINLRYHVKSFMIASSRSFRLSANAAAPEFAASVQSLEKTAQDLTAYDLAHHNEGGLFYDTADFLNNVSAYVAAIKSAKISPAGGAPDLRPVIVSSYNKLVSSYNRNVR